MKRAKKILVCLDADHDVGLGHAVRTSAVLGVLDRPVSIGLSGKGAQLDEFFPRTQRFASANDVAGVRRAITEFSPDLLLVDLVSQDATWWQEIHKLARDVSVVAIDDFGGEVIADLVINGTVVERYHRYPRLRAGARVLAGASHTLLRTEFSAQRWSEPPNQSVTIVVGSGNAARDWAFALVSGELALGGWGNVRMIVGAAFPDKAQLGRACSARGVQFNSGLSGAEVARALAASTAALTTGGMVVYEAVAIGVPTVVFPQMDNMIPEMNWLASAGCITDIGPKAGDALHRIGEAVSNLLDSRERRLAMTVAQRAVSDGRGAYRAANAIRKLIDKDSA